MPANLASFEVGVRPCVAFLSTGQEPTSANAEERLMPRLNAKEVAEIFTAPLQKFVRARAPLDGTDTHTGVRYEGSWIQVKSGGRWRAHRFYVPKQNAAKVDDAYTVWGLTARILVDAARLAYDVTPDFEHNETMGEEAMLEKFTCAPDGEDRMSFGDSKLV